MKKPNWKKMTKAELIHWLEFSDQVMARMLANTEERMPENPQHDWMGGCDAGRMMAYKIALEIIREGPITRSAAA